MVFFSVVEKSMSEIHTQCMAQQSGSVYVGGFDNSIVIPCHRFEA